MLGNINIIILSLSNIFHSPYIKIILLKISFLSIKERSKLNTLS